MRNKTTATLLAIFLGGLGAHRFYLGHYKLGFFYLIFSWTFVPVIIGLYDSLRLLRTPQSDFDIVFNGKQPIKKEVIKEKDVVKAVQVKPDIEPHTPIVKTNISSQQMSKYQKLTTQRAVMQVLETLRILLSTKNLDTLIGRYDFLLEVYPIIVEASNNSEYLIDVQVAVDNYKRLYYSTIITDIEMSLVLSPKPDLLSSIYGDCIKNCFEDYYMYQMAEIGNLKRENAKVKRYQDIILNADIALSELKERGHSNPNFSRHFDLIKSYKELAMINSNQQASSEVFTFEISIDKGVESEAMLSEGNVFGAIKKDNQGGWIINPGANFEITLLFADEKAAKEIRTILDKNSEEMQDYKKQEIIAGLLAEKNIKIKEIEEYKSKYKSQYYKVIDELKKNYVGWDELGDKDKEDILIEFRERAINSLEEQADCELQVLFENEPTDIKIDDELIAEYGFVNIRTYLRYANNLEKIRVFSNNDYARPMFDELLKKGLAINGDEIPIEEVLSTLTLKELNNIISDPAKVYKRKNQAIEVIVNFRNLDEIISKNIALKCLFKLLPLPEKYNDIETKELIKTFAYHEEEAKLLVNTYMNTVYLSDSFQSNIGDGKYRVVSTHSDLCSCTAHFKDSFSAKNNKPKLPRHIGGPCYVHREY